MTLALNANERDLYRSNTNGMGGITLTPPRKKCYCCDKWKNSLSGTTTDRGFKCHSCGRTK